MFNSHFSGIVGIVTLIALYITCIRSKQRFDLKFATSAKFSDDNKKFTAKAATFISIRNTIKFIYFVKSQAIYLDKDFSFI